MERKAYVRDFYLGGNDLETFYVELRGEAHMAVQPYLETERRCLWELVAHGMQHMPSTTRRLIGCTHPESAGFFFFGANKERNADPLAVRAASTVLEEMEPSWIRAVDEARALADSPQVLAAWSELPVEVVLAATGNWRTRL